MLSVVMLNVFMLNVVMLNVVMQNVVMLNVVILSVVEPLDAGAVKSFTVVIIQYRSKLVWSSLSVTSNLV